MTHPFITGKQHDRIEIMIEQIRRRRAAEKLKEQTVDPHADMIYNAS